MSPWVHAKNSAKKWGGSPENYLPIHEFLDSTKLHETNWSHRMILHNTFGVGLCEQLFGPIIINDEGKEVEVRYIAIQHIQEDFGGKVPTIRECLEGLPPKKWSINLNK